MDCVVETPVGIVNLHRMRVAEDLLEIAELLVESFPSEERRPLWMYPPLLARGDTRFYRVVHGGHTVGLLNLWDWGSLCYGEHMALRPELRGRGMGEAILRGMITSAERPFVLEVEPPGSDIQRRRIGLYERLGLRVAKRDYMQPSYRAGGQEVPLWIMCSEGHEQQVEAMVERIRIEVYGEKNGIGGR